MTPEANTELVLSWYEAQVMGDAKRAFDLLHEEFRWYLPGNMPMSGWTDRAGYFAAGESLGRHAAGPITMRFGEAMAQDDRVLIEAESELDLVDGGRYTNSYIIAARVRDGKIVEIKEFMDTLHLYQTIDAPLVRGEPKQRESHLDRVTRTFTGAFSNQYAGTQRDGISNSST
jgi:ketosteroid isomerase-like protein